MKKDAYWFKHDSNASRDLKLMQIKAIYGLEGLGIFWSVLEVLREQKNFEWSEKQLKVLSKIIDCDETKLQNFLNDCKRIELLSFERENIFSVRLKKDMKNWVSKKKNRTKSERKFNDFGTNLEDKIIIEDIKEDKRILKQQFEEFRILYGGVKKGLDTEFENFTKKHKDWKEIIPLLKTAIEKQKLWREQNKGKTVDGRPVFIPEWKNLQTWINQRCWEEQVTITQKIEQKRITEEDYHSGRVTR